MPITEAKKRANERFNAKTYDQIKVVVKKGDRDKIKAYAESKELSLNSYITTLIEKDMDSPIALNKSKKAAQC